MIPNQKYYMYNNFVRCTAENALSHHLPSPPLLRPYRVCVEHYQSIIHHSFQISFEANINLPDTRYTYVTVRSTQDRITRNLPLKLDGVVQAQRVSRGRSTRYDRRRFPVQACILGKRMLRMTSPSVNPAAEKAISVWAVE